MAEKAMIYEVVAVFDSREAVENAIEELQSNGFGRRQLSLLASPETVAQKLGHAQGDVRELADDPEAPRQAPVEAADQGDMMGLLVGTPAAIAGLAAAAVTALSGGALAGIAVAALAGTGGGAALGGVLAKLFSDRVAAYFEEQLAKGGILLWVSLAHPEREATAREILSRHASGEVRSHTIAA